MSCNVICNITKTNEKSAQRDANTVCALAVVRFGHRPPARHITNTQTHRQDRLQYTAPLASAQCNKPLTTQYILLTYYLLTYLLKSNPGNPVPKPVPTSNHYSPLLANRSFDTELVSRVIGDMHGGKAPDIVGLTDKLLLNTYSTALRRGHLIQTFSVDYVMWPRS